MHGTERPTDWLRGLCLHDFRRTVLPNGKQLATNIADE
jgi:hypothetical protein